MNTKELILSNGISTLVDEEDFYWLNQWRWHAAKIGNNVYAVRSRRNNHLGLSSRAYLHRIIQRVEDKNLIVDHIDNDGLNNCKINLRTCTTTENKRNITSQKGSSSKYLGVSFDKNRQKWTASLTKLGGRKFSKRFDSEIEAAKAYDIAAVKHFGEFANLNFK